MEEETERHKMLIQMGFERVHENAYRHKKYGRMGLEPNFTMEDIARGIFALGETSGQYLHAYVSH